MSTSLLQLVAQTVKSKPQKTAVVYKHTGLSYHQLNTISNQLAAFLLEKGITKGSIVGIMIDRSVEMLVSMLAVMKAGAAYVPVDPEYPGKRIEYILQDCEARLLISNAKYKSDIDSNIERLIIEEIWPEIDSYTEHEPDLEIHGNDLAYLIYTSGSTGLPKGVMIEHHSILNLLQSMLHFPGIDQDDKLLAITTISFDISILELLLPLTVGATLYLADAETAKNGEALIELIQSREISFFQATPSTYKMMIATGWKKKLNIKALCCGEQLPKDLADKLLSRVSALYNMYGPTETTIYSTGKQILPEDQFITIGKPINKTRVYILDEQQKEVPEGETGEIYIAGSGLARTYYGKPELSQKKFRLHTFQNETTERLYRTGDLGKLLPNQEIQCFGRIDHQVKIRGYRIETGEIEHALLQIPNIKEALVKPWTNLIGDESLVAYVVYQSGAITNLAQINQWKDQLRTSLPNFMIPTYFVILNQMPLTENGKIDRKALPTPDPEQQSPTLSPPESDNEKLLTKIWQDQLGLSNIGIEDNFFNLGGHSLIAVMIISLIRKETGKNLPLGSLFNNPTIAQLAKLLDETTIEEQFESLVPLKTGGSRNPLYIVHGMGSTVFKFRNLANKLHPEQPVYGFQARGIDGTTTPSESIEEMAKHYLEEMLKHNPEGPYVLSGYSLGGLVAVEMARQLKLMNKKVALLAVFDSFIIKNNQLAPGLYKSLHKTFSRFAKFIYTFSLLAHEPQRTIRHKIYSLKRGIMKLLGQEVGNETGLDHNFDHIGHVMEYNYIAVERYRAKYYDGDLHIFKARKAATYLSDFKYLGWKPYVKHIHLHMIEGDHLYIFDNAYNDRFAKELQEVLDHL